MTTIALAIWFALFALINLGAKLPDWVLGVAAIVVVIALIVSGGWRNKSTIIIALLLPTILLTGCMTPGGLAKMIKSADTAHKSIEVEFSGWNAHVKYRSRPVYENDAGDTSTAGVTIRSSLKVMPAD